MKKFLYLGIFAVAMGFLEAINVVYLRELNREIFGVKRLISIELAREISTIAMLVMVAALTGKNFVQKLSYFLFVFGFWDIFYYAGLKTFIDWPPSLLTWDLLFMIPFPWQAPVLAPLICSLMIILFAVHLQLRSKKLIKITVLEWGLFFGGTLIIFLGFIWRSLQTIIQEGILFQLQKWSFIDSYNVSTAYNWFLFLIGILLISGALVWRVVWRAK